MKFRKLELTLLVVVVWLFLTYLAVQFVNVDPVQYSTTKDPSNEIKHTGITGDDTYLNSKASNTGTKDKGIKHRDTSPDVKDNDSGIKNNDPSRLIKACKGHYHLCRFRDILSRSKLYGRQIYLSDDIHDFSSVTQFKTSFFRTRPNLTVRVEDRPFVLTQIGKFMAKEFPQTWYAQNLWFGAPDNATLTRLCSFNSLNYVKYDSSLSGSIDPSWPANLYFQVNESILHTLPSAVHYSNIYATVTSSVTIAVCRTESYLTLGNVTQYSITCPILERNFTVAIKSTFSTGSVYIRKCQDQDTYNRVLQTFTSANLQSIPLAIIRDVSTLPVCVPPTTEHAPGFWINRGNVWHWSNYKCYFPFTIDTKLMTCLNKTKLMMFGDSHTNYRNDAFLKYFPWWNSTFIGVTVASHLVHELRKHESMLRTQNVSTAVVLNSGQWSYVYAEPLSYIADMTEIYTLIKSFKEKSPLLKFIWVETTPVSYERTAHGRFRENNIIAALNDLVNWNMEKMEVPVVKAYDIAVPMEFTPKDHAHYCEFLGEDVISHNHNISVGGAISSVLFNMICKN